MSVDIRTKKVIKGTLLYSIGTFGTKILNFIVVPLYTYYISTADMGIYDMLISTASLLTPIITFQISDAAYRWMIRKEKIEDSICSTYRVLIINSVIASIICIVFGLIFRVPYLFLFLPYLLSSRGIQTLQKLIRGLNRQALYAICSIVHAAILLLLNVIMVCGFKTGIVGLFYGSIISNLISIAFLIIAEPKLRINPFLRRNKQHTRSLLKYAIPLIPNQLNWWIISSSDRYVINLLIGSSANGIYSMAYKFPTLLQTILNLFYTSWQDMSVARDSENDDYNNRMFEKIYSATLTAVPMLTALTQLYIILTMQESYHGAAAFVSFLYLGTVFQFFSSFYGIGYLRNKKTKHASYTSIVGATMNVVVNVLLIRQIGLHAAAFSTFIGFFTMWIIRAFQNKKALNMSLKYWKFTTYLLYAIASSILSMNVSIQNALIILVIGVIVFIIINRKIIVMIPKTIYLKTVKK